jgi:KipI family sensor histidine kinase inhibitor
VGEAALLVELGRAIDPGLNARVRALDRALAEQPLPGLRECVPAYASLLVVFDPGRTSHAEVGEAVRARLGARSSAETASRRHVLPVSYGGDAGPDLEDVARKLGLTPADVVRAHAAAEVTAYFLGFLPGFAYLGLLPDAFAIPRLPTPRPRVPAGSVGIASRQTAVYPWDCPGGWNLVGRTSVRLFDPAADPPALLQPGDAVGFRASDDDPAAAPRAPSADPTGGPIEVVDGGFLTTVQDAGRFGHRRSGVPWCGTADAGARVLANRAVGNPPGAAVLECTATGPALHFLAPVRFAIAGGDFQPVLERADLGAWPVPRGRAVLARPGNVLTFLGRRAGFRAVVGFAGGLDAPLVLGSRSTDLVSGFGGFQGRALRAGDRLAVGAGSGSAEEALDAPVPGDRAVVRVVPGPHDDAFAPGALDRLCSAEYVVGALSDRLGARLDGPVLAHRGPAEVVTDGQVPGCVQVPPDGRPIVLLCDSPTTGGYPRVATVVGEDLSLLAQLVPGEGRVRFVRA